MSEDSGNQSDLLELLIAKYLEAEKSGEVLDRYALIQQHPDLAVSLKEFFANHDRMKGAAEVNTPTLPPTSSDVVIDEPTLAPDATPTDIPTLPPDAEPREPPRVGTKVRYFGDYELLEEIARGGMGVVYRAKQINLNRIVALKMILAGQFAGQEDVQRFYTEAEAAANLDHPGIVPIFEIGEHNGQHYFSMGYIEGKSLAQKVTDGPLPPHEAAEMVKKIGDAMAYAHERGVIRRDLKPANILIDVTSGQPKVTDFGLAKKTEADSNLTGTGQILGTPAYMPPEQASGRTEEVGPLADVYSLGGILYCLLTGRPPFQAASPMDTLLQVLDQEPVSPRTLNPKVPQDLETICLKCLNKDAKKRYKSSADVSAELQRYLRGQPIHARPVGSLERSWRWCKRNPAVATLSGLAVVLLILGSAISTFFALEARQEAEIAANNEAAAISQSERALAEKERADTERDKAVRQTQIAERRLYSSQIASAYREWTSNNAAAAAKYTRDCRWDFRGWEHDYLNTLMTQSFVCRGHKKAVRYVGFTDRTRVVSCAENLMEYDIATGRVAVSEDIRIGGSGLALTADHSQIVTFSSGVPGRIRVVDRHTAETSPTISNLKSISCMAADPRGGRLAVATYSSKDGGVVQLLDLQTGEPQKAFDGYSGRVYSLTYSPDGTRLLAGAADGTIITWNADSGERLLKIAAHNRRIRAVAFGPRGKRVYTSGDDNLIKCWDLQTGDLQLTLWGHTNPVTSLCVRFDGLVVASGSTDTTVRTWNADSGEQISVYRGHVQPVTCIAMNSDGTYLASGGADTEVRIWNLEADTDVLARLARGVNCISVSPDGSTCAINGDQGTIQLVDTTTHQAIRTIAGHQRPAIDVTFSPDGKLLASCASFSGNVKVWEANSGEQLHSFDAHEAYPTAVAFSPDGSRIVSGGGNSSRRDRTSGKMIRSLGEIKVWEAPGKERKKLKRDHKRSLLVLFQAPGDICAVKERTATAERGPRWWYMAVLLAREGDIDQARSYYAILVEETKRKRALRQTIRGSFGENSRNCSALRKKDVSPSVIPSRKTSYSGCRRLAAAVPNSSARHGTKITRIR